MLVVQPRDHWQLTIIFTYLKETLPDRKTFPSPLSSPGCRMIQIRYNRLTGENRFNAYAGEFTQHKHSRQWAKMRHTCHSGLSRGRQGSEVPRGRQVIHRQMRKGKTCGKQTLAGSPRNTGNQIFAHCHTYFTEFNYAKASMLRFPFPSRFFYLNFFRQVRER